MSNLHKYKKAIMKTAVLFILIASSIEISSSLNRTKSQFEDTASYPLLSQGIPQSDKKERFFEIKYEELLKQSNKFKLSDIASDIKYIKLETREDCLIGSMPKYYFCDSLIFVTNKNSILKFSSSGKFLKQIGSPGRGPGEINYIREMSILSAKRVLIIHDAGAKKLLYFSFDGNLLKSVSVPSIFYLKVMNDGNFIAYEGAYAKSETFYFFLTNEKGDTIASVKNYKKWENPSGSPVLYLNPTYEPFYSFQNNYYSKSMYNDTVYVVNSNKFKPSYFINLGKFKLPEEKRVERLSLQEAQSFRDVSSDYYFANVFEARDRIFLTSYCFGKGSPNYIVINKNGFINGSKSAYDGVSNGILINDYDGGMYFWPEGTANDNQVFMPIDVSRIRRFLELAKSNKIQIKYPDKQTQLETQISNLDITSNPIIMVVTLKPGM